MIQTILKLATWGKKWNIDKCVWELLVQQSPLAGKLRWFDHPPQRHPRQWFTPCILFYILSSRSSILAQHMEPGFALCILSSRLQQVQQPVYRPPLSWSLLWGLWDVARCRWSWDVAGSLIPTLWEMRFFCSPSCSCNFDQALMWLGSDPYMIGPGTCKRSPWRGGGGTTDQTSKPGEERNYSEGVFPLLLLCLVGNKGFMYSFFPSKNCDL